jgi:hypothetical protein
VQTGSATRPVSYQMRTGGSSPVLFADWEMAWQFYSIARHCCTCKTTVSKSWHNKTIVCAGQLKRKLMLHINGSKMKMTVFWVVAPFYQTTQRCNPEDSHLHTHHRENLKSYGTKMLKATCSSTTTASPTPTQSVDSRHRDREVMLTNHIHPITKLEWVEVSFSLHAVVLN